MSILFIALATLLLLLCAHDLSARSGNFLNYCLGVGALVCAFLAGTHA